MITAIMAVQPHDRHGNGRDGDGDDDGDDDDEPATTLNGIWKLAW
jgi:hypothetical protein